MQTNFVFIRTSLSTTKSIIGVLIEKLIMESCIPETFRNATVLVTGSTGFLGKILVEKILRACPIKKIAVLVRNKKGINANQRVADIYKQAVSNIFFKIIDHNLQF